MNAIDRLQELTRPTGEEDLLAVRYPKPRVSVPVKPAAAAVAALLLGVGAWAAVRGGGDDDIEWEQVASPTEVESVVVVAVVGEVANPGLKTLNEGSRIADALQMAQPLPHADLLAHNQAQLLVDGQQILVQAVGAAPAPGPPDAAGAAAGGSGSSATGTVSLNSATAAELTALPGVGEATAAAIVAHREANGPFATVEQLMDVRGIGPAKFEAMRAQVAL